MHAKRRALPSSFFIIKFKLSLERQHNAALVCIYGAGAAGGQHKYLAETVALADDIRKLLGKWQIVAMRDYGAFAFGGLAALLYRIRELLKHLLFAACVGEKRNVAIAVGAH